MRCLSAFVAALLLGASPAFGDAPVPPPLEAFARLPAMAQPQLSPDGRHLAYLAALGGTRMIVVKPLDGDGKERVIAPDKGELVGFSFPKNDRLVMTVRTATDQASSAARMGTGVWVSQQAAEVQRLVSVDLQGGNTRMLSPIGNLSDFSRAGYPGGILHPLPDSPDEVVMMVQEDAGSYPSVARVNLRTGDRVTLQKPVPQVFYWTVGQDGNPVAGVRIRDEKDILLVRDDNGWTETVGARFAAKEALVPLSRTDQPDRVLVLAKHETDTVGLYQFDTKEKRLSDRVGDWSTDVTGLMGLHGSIVGVRLAGDMPGQALFDPTLQSITASVDKAVPQTREQLLDMSQDGGMMLFASMAPGRPTSYILFNTREKQLYPLGSAYPELPVDNLPKRSAVSFPARDGRAIPAIITLPVGVPPSRLPFVVLPHGGPHAHDDLTFNWVAQFLASRGYGVIQPNFRGSTGHGYAHWAAGRGQWGRAMQDDLVDAAKWLADQQLADAGRICVAGISYGGYAAQVAAFRDKETFRCAASINGISELVRIYDSRVDDPRDDVKDSLGGNRTELGQFSPLRQAERVGLPLLLIHAEDDTVVPSEQSVRMAEALKSAGKPHELLLLPKGSHWLTAAGDRITMLKKLESFLAEHLGPTHGG